MRFVTYLFFLFSIFLMGCKDADNPSVTNNYYNYYLADSLTNPNVQPKVVFTSPPNGSIGPFTNLDIFTGSYVIPQITIQFNKLINVNSFTSANIRLSTKDTSYSLYINSTNITPYLQNILILDNRNKYLANKVYSVTVDTTLTDVHGYKLSRPYTFSFTPEPKFRVISGSPTSAAVNTTNYSFITLNLNSKVDTSFFEKVQINPPIKGRWQFNPYGYSYSIYDSTTLYYVSKDTLLYDTQYVTTVAGDAKDIQGLPIDASYQFSFTTQSFQVEYSSSSSQTGPNGFTILSYVQFYFNGYVDTSTVRSSISITPNLAFDISFSSPNIYRGFRDVYVKPNGAQMQRNTTYQITINSTVRSQKGAYLKKPYTYSFITGS